MKATRGHDFIFGAEEVSRQKSDFPASDESLFSQLLEIENRLGAGGQVESKRALRGRKASGLKGLKRSMPENLSRYVE